MIRWNRKNLATAMICANLLFIWGNSLLPASVSGAFSRWVKDLLDLLVGGDGLPTEGDGPLRKLAHFLEFCSLGALLGWRFSMNRGKFWIPPALLLGVSAACVDELLQQFVPGRAPRITDVGIDALGVALGICLLVLGKYIKKTKQTTGG